MYSPITTRRVADEALYKRGGGGGGFIPPTKVQAIWFIDSTANRNNSGATINKPIPWNEFQRRIGLGTEITAGPGVIIDVTVLNLLETDPITLDNYIAPGCFLFVHGKITVLATGALTASQAINRATNQRGTITSPGLGAFVGRQIEILTGGGAGNRSRILKDLGGGVVQVGQWVTGIDTTGAGILVSYGTLPGVGDTYRIVDYPSAWIGPASIGADASDFDFAGPAFFLPGVNFQNLKFVPTAGLGPATTEMPTAKDIGVLINFSQCYFEQGSEIGACLQINITECIFNSGLTHDFDVGSFVFGQFNDIINGSVLSFADRCIWDGDSQLVGPVPIVAGTGLGAAIFAAKGASVDLGPIGLWDVNFGLFSSQGAVLSAGGKGFLGNVNYNQIYGDDNGFPIGIEGGCLFIVSGLDVFGNPTAPTATVILPTVAFPLADTSAGGANPPLPANLGWLFNRTASQVGADATTNDVGSRSVPFDTVTAAYHALQSNTWAKLDVDVGATGFRTEIVPSIPVGSHFHFANAQRPTALSGGGTFLSALVTP